MSIAYRSVRRRRTEICGLLVLSGWAAIGCTSLLDIDDEYTLQTETGGDSAGFSGGGAGGAFQGFGGSWPESSGARGFDAGPSAVPGAGGAVVVATGGVPPAGGGGGGEPATGGVSPQTGGVDGTGGILDLPDAAGPECATGKFEGTFKGTHAPSITFVGVPVPVEGAVTFELVDGGTPHKLKVAEARFNGRFDILPGASGVPFTATMAGDYDCNTKQLSGELLKGSFADPDANQTFIGFSGSFSARLGTRFTGTWNEVESTSAQYKGDGTFTATRVLR